MSPLMFFGVENWPRNVLAKALFLMQMGEEVWAKTGSEDAVA